MSKGNVMTKNTASLRGLGEIVLGDVIWFAAQNSVDSNMSDKAKQPPVYSVIRHYIVFINKIMLWQSESYKSDGESAYQTNISQLSETNISV